MRIVAADGTRWWIGRRWLPWRPKQRFDAPDWDGSGAAGLDMPDGDEPVGCAIAMGIFVAILVLPILVVATIFVAEWLALLLLLPILTLVRIGFGMPWTIVARGKRPDGVHVRYSGQVRGWGASRRLIDEVEVQIRTFGAPRALNAATGS
jgi:hypothetical protein